MSICAALFLCRSKYFRGRKIFGDWDIRVEQVYIYIMWYACVGVCDMCVTIVMCAFVRLLVCLLVCVYVDVCVCVRVCVCVTLCVYAFLLFCFFEIISLRTSSLPMTLSFCIFYTLFSYRLLTSLSVLLEALEPIMTSANVFDIRRNSQRSTWPHIQNQEQLLTSRSLEVAREL